MTPISLFKKILRDDQIITDDRLSSYSLDRTKTVASFPKCVLLPKSTKNVSDILKMCSENNIKVIPAGGRTGLSGALVSTQDEIVVSLEKMNKIIEIDQVGATISVETGAILENVQNEALKHNLYFPLDFAAKGSCMIGGCLSTNAGGVKVIKYGMTRSMVLGLEVVLPDGRILDLNKALVKDNSGYDLKQIFIGAEGTLGIITKATFQCVALPKNKQLMLLSVDSFDLIPKIFQSIKSLNANCLAFEFITDIGMRAVLNAMPQLKSPFSELSNYFVLIEFDNKSKNLLEQISEKLFSKDLISDAVIAENSQMFNDFWLIREAVSDSLYLKGKVHANDVSVPIKDLDSFVVDLNHLIKNKYRQYTLGLFGHIGDGNFHIYIIDENLLPDTIWKESIKELDNEMFALVKKFNGSISAEHGIGLFKKEALPFQKSETERLYAKKIKEIFDPKMLMNPDKIL